MNQMIEVLFTCDNNDQQLTCTAWDFRTGTSLMTYKGGGSAQKGSLCFVQSNYLISANNAKPLIHAWPINSQTQLSSARYVASGNPSALAVSPDGIFLVAGIQEVIYIWHLPTGRMVNSITKHYQKLNCIKFTDDGSHFVSAGQDGGVMVWNLTQVASRSDENQTPLYSFNDHGLPVTDVHIGIGGIRAYMTTVSFDRSCKIYDLCSGALLLCVVFMESLLCVAVNGLETCVYVGTSEGSIYEFHIGSLPRTKEYHLEDLSNKFTGHSGEVTCLAISLDNETLVSGGMDNKVCIWHIPSKRLLKSLLHKGAITNIALRITCLALFSSDQKQPQALANNLKRMLDPVETDEEEVVEVLIGQDSGTTIENDSIPGACLPHDPRMLAESNNIQEVMKLRAELENLKRINKTLFEVSVKALLKKR